MNVVAFGVAALVAAAPIAPMRTVEGQLRFHHLHFRTGDPAAAMNAMAIRAEGTRVILPGLGVGVRTGDQYALFDRLTTSPAIAAGELGAARPAAGYAAGVAWLEAHGFVVAPREFGATRLASVLPEGGQPATAQDLELDHVAFAAADLTAAVAALHQAGVEPVRRTSESAMYALKYGILLEIARDGDRPDAFWCPMHPEVRSPAAEKCPLCSMALVPIPPPTLGHYRMTVTQIPRAAGNGAGALRLEIRHPETSAAVTSFSQIHERLLHLFIVGRDLSYFAHVHPEKTAEGFELPVDLEPGAYLLIADFVPSGGSPQLLQQAIVTRGYAGSPYAAVAPKVDLADKIADGLRISLEAAPRAGRESELRFSVRDAASGAPVTDLEPFLGAPGHLLVVNGDLTEAIHAHPEGVDAAPPEAGRVVFAPILPTPGVYKVWVQVQRHGQVTTASFAVEAR